MKKSNLSIALRYGYGLGEFGMNFLLTYITYYLTFYLTNVAGLSMALRKILKSKNPPPASTAICATPKRMVIHSTVLLTSP